ncbi:hypothetical protein [Paraferrimonas sedimenticola]|uniref:hypothetical protein n=1 Tax=Paraferrimonas sedimenticola TaxID=375674 RepID=UPI003CCC462C
MLLIGGTNRRFGLFVALIEQDQALIFGLKALLFGFLVANGLGECIEIALQDLLRQYRVIALRLVAFGLEIE